MSDNEKPTIRITIEMTEEEAHAYFFVTGSEHPGRRSMERKLNGWAQQHPSIREYVRAREQERIDSHESHISQDYDGLWEAYCACGWNSRAYRDRDKAKEAQTKHVFKGQAEARRRRAAGKVAR
jgi:hypothetical protein